MKYPLALSTILAIDFVVIMLKIWYADRKQKGGSAYTLFNNQKPAAGGAMPTAHFWADSAKTRPANTPSNLSARNEVRQVKQREPVQG